MLDFFDDWIWGPGNTIFRLFGVPARLLKPSKGGRMGATIQIRLLRKDKGGKRGLHQVTDHLKRYGVATFDHGFNAQYCWFSVRTTQVKFARWLYNNGDLRTPKRAWRDK